MTDALRRPFDTVLVANRGENARRIIRSLRAQGLRSVAVYSDADADAPHVRGADLAVRLGPAAPAESYLNIPAVIDAAQSTGAGAVHPGYGFLSENAAFAHACADAGIIFIGPDERALEVMGDKIRAKEHVAAHGVPVVPGFSARDLDDAEISRRADEVGFPLLVKPSAGGGGKGMQVVRSAGELEEALATARRIARAAFGDDTLLLERLIERPRHIEVQVLADAHGATIHLGERECTLQRRHQKVIEESPSPLTDPATRDRLGAAAVAAAQSVDYRGAGTVEFLVSADAPDEFFFIEMNTRLQVEHPVTEEVTGIDLVAAQVDIAAGLPLGLVQEDVTMRGHAIEARVYAESPARGFLPATGDVLLWRAPGGTRADGAVETGSVVTADYDPMIAKVIARAADRTEALRRLSAALHDTVVLGVDTNIDFLLHLLAQPDVMAGTMDTGLIDRLSAFTDPAPPARALELAAATAPVSATGVGAWRELSGWRLTGDHPRDPLALLSDDGSEHAGSIGDPARYGEASGMDADGSVWVHADGRTVRLRPIDRRERAALRRAAAAREAGAVDPLLRAPMPGTVVAVHVTDGAAVAAGDRIVTIEAMKMEHAVTAPFAGAAHVGVAVGEHVRRDQTVARMTAQDADEEGK